MKYIALLRGINVGGNNKVPMAQLKRLFEESGFTDVVTYINSGNIIFNSSMASIENIARTCKEFLATNFSFKIPVMIIPATDLCDAIENAPDWWNCDENSKHNAIFVIPPMRATDVFSQIGEAKLEYENVGSFGNVIFWSAPVSTFSRTRYSKIATTALYPNITIRNANTTIKLAELVKKII